MSSDIMRLAGINSGYDTESMIEKLMTSYQSKIDTQNKKLQKLTWQQDAYRDITSKLTEFQNKYFDILKRDTYLMSPNTFNKFKSTVTNKANPDRPVSGVSVITTNSSIEGNHTLKVKQTATATKLSGNTVVPENFKLDLNKAAYGDAYYKEDDGSRTYSYALDVKVGGVTKTVEFDVNVTEDSEGKVNLDDFTNAITASLNTKLEEAFGTTGRTSGITGGVNAAGEELFVSVAKGAEGTLEFKVGGNADVTVTEKAGNFGLTAPASKVNVSMEHCVTGLNAVYIEVGDVARTVSFNGVSSTYFDSRNQPGNEAILEEFNQLKREAFARANPTVAVTDDVLKEFKYTSAQAAKDKNSMALMAALGNQFTSQGILFTIDTNGYLTATKNGKETEFTISSIAGGTLGINKGSASNKFSTSTSLKNMGFVDSNDEVSLNINGKEITVKGSDSIDELIKAVNKSDAGVTMEYSKLENKFVVTANDMGNGGDVKIEANAFTAALGLAANETTALSADIGKNAIFEIDGVEVYHNANAYDIDGVTINFDGAEIGSEYEIDVSKDFDTVKKTIKDFVDDYNKMVEEVFKYIDTAPKRDANNNLYEPLTDAEKEEMTEKEIEKWEDFAKQGILYNDSTVSGIMSRLRSVLYTSITLEDGSKFNLYSMGVKTTSFLDGNPDDAALGKLTIDEDKLEKAFREKPEAITQLFTDSENGVMSKVNKVIESAVKSSSTSQGSLIRKAGLATGTSAKNNAIYRQMEQINKRIETLKKRYETKEDYWWSVFTNLEKMMSNMNSQMSYMQSYLGGGGTTVQ